MNTNAIRKPPRAINKITAYRAYQVLLAEVWREGTREPENTVPVSVSTSSGIWWPSPRETAGESGTSAKDGNYHRRCQSRIHCRILLLRALDGLDVPNDVRDVVDRAVEILQERLHASEDLARGLVMALKNENMRKALEI